MSGASLKLERIRNGLSELILSELESWQDLHRQVFIQSHYRGQSVEQMSNSFGLCSSEVRMILQQCDRRLRQALKAFRESRQESDSSLRIQPHVMTRGYLF